MVGQIQRHLHHQPQQEQTDPQAGDNHIGAFQGLVVHPVMKPCLEMLGGQATDEFDDQTQSGHARNQRHGKQRGIAGIGNESEDVVIAGLMSLPCPNQADAYRHQTRDRAHYRLALNQSHNNLQYRQHGRNRNGEIQIARGHEQYDEHHAGQHGFDDATRATDGVDDGEILAFIAGVG